MRTATKCGRWLGLLMVLTLFAGTAYAQRNVTLQLNTATLPDTTKESTLIEVRGAVEGTGGVTLPDGNIIDWNASTTLEPQNVGGDFWEIQFQIPDNQTLAFKFFSQQAEDPNGDGDGSDGIGGWEDGPNHAIEAGTGDVDLGLHYFLKGPDQPYDWRPFEEKADSIGVWFRVYMNTENAVTAGYNRTASGLVVGVRGNDFSATGPLDWGVTKLRLSPESGDRVRPGYHLFSGVAYYPESMAGQEQAFKFFVEPSGWEGTISDRKFIIPQKDSTLRWVYFDESKPVSGVGPVQSAVIFTVDLSPMVDIGIFNLTRGDTLEVRGDFNGWDCTGAGAPDDCLLVQVPGAPEFEQAVAITAIPQSTRNYKFFLNLNDEAFQAEFGRPQPSGWEEPISTTGANRQFVFEGIQGGFQDLGVKRFNDVLPGNIIPVGSSVAVNFSVDMTAALSNPDPFVPGSDSVTIQIDDPIWAFTQNVDGNQIPGFELTDDDGDMVYTGSLLVSSPTYGALQYRYAYGGRSTGTYFGEEGGGFSDLGRRRTRFIAPNPDGTWPPSWDFPDEVFQPTGTLPFDPNPVATGVEVVEGEVPAQISLSQNYPNPFNPETTFTYTIDHAQKVTVRVYDLLGRVVATLVDGVQPAATYQVTFDASDLASGIYLYQIETPTTALSKRMVLIK